MPVTPLGFRFQRVSPSGSRHASRRAYPSCCLSRRANTPSRSSKDSCTQKVRTRWAGVTRDPTAEPLLAFPSSRVSPLGSQPRASTKPPLMGFSTTRTMMAAVSGRERPCTVTGFRRTCSAEYQRAEDWLASFESCLPPRGFQSSNPHRSKVPEIGRAHV